MTIRHLSAYRPVRLLVVVAAIGLTGCSSTTATGAPTAAAPASIALTVPTAAPSVQADASSPAQESAAPEATGGPTAVPTSINPCDLVPAAEASALVGTTFASGKATSENNTRICTYGQEGVVFEVLVGVAPDAATAKAQEPAFKKQLEDGVAQAGLKDVKLTELPGFEPGVDAAVLSGSASAGGISVKGVALYALKGAVFVALSEVSIGGSVASSDAMQAQAHTTLGRLP